MCPPCIFDVLLILFRVDVFFPSASLRSLLLVNLVVAEDLGGYSPELHTVPFTMGGCLLAPYCPVKELAFFSRSPICTFSRCPVFFIFVCLLRVLSEMNLGPISIFRLLVLSCAFFCLRFFNHSIFCLLLSLLCPLAAPLSSFLFSSSYFFSLANRPHFVPPFLKRYAIFQSKLSLLSCYSSFLLGKSSST